MLVDVPRGLDGQAGARAARPGPRTRSRTRAPASATARPGTPTGVWRQVSVSAPRVPGRGASARSARSASPSGPRRGPPRSQLVVTNHRLLAIDAIEGVPMIPEYDVVVVDEAHELSARVTQAATDELSVSDVERAARRAQRYVEDTQADDLDDAAGALEGAIATTATGRIDSVPAGPRRRAGAGARRRPGLPRRRCPRRATADADAGRTQAAGRSRRSSTTPSGWPRTRRPTCSGSPSASGARGGPQLCVAPLQVWGPMRDRLLTDKTVVFTSATLMLGGDFATVRLLGRAQADRAGGQRAGARPADVDRGRRRAAVARHRRRVAVRLRPAGDPVRRPAPAAARPRRARQGPARRDRRAGRRRRGPHPRAVLQPPGRRGRGRGGPRAGCRT